MTNGEAINWIINISADIGKVEHRDLWHYEQALSEIREMLETEQPEPCELCSNLEKGDTLYQSSDWDGGIGFDYIWDIRFCPKCGRSLE